MTLALDVGASVFATATIDEPQGIPGRPMRPALAVHMGLSHGSLRTIEGRAALVHSIAHIELNAVDLAADICWRFAGMPDQFYRDWVAIAKESYKYLKAILPHDPKPEDVCDYLALSLQARDDFVVLKASKKAKEKFWFAAFADLVVDRKWTEIKGG